MTDIPKDIGAQVKRRAQAVADLLETINGYTLGDIGPHLTCGEAEVLAEFYRAYHRDGAADMLMEGHAEGDDPEDAHYGWTPDDDDDDDS